MEDAEIDAEIWAQWERRRASLAGTPLVPAPAALPEAGKIPPREWLYGTRLIRSFVSVLAAPGGVGKSALALGIAVALATGRPILGEHVHHSVPVWLYNLEDPLDELNRRLAALMQLHALPAAAVAGRLYLNSGRARRLTMAAADGEAGVAHPDREGLIAAVRALGIGAVVVDPFVKSHRLDENSNMHMDAAATAWAEVAEATGAAVLLVHHVRKGAGALAGTDVDVTRGAKALTDAARAAFLLSVMTAEEAHSLAVPERERWRHVRLDDAKANLAPRSEAARWFRLESVSLGNSTPAYPGGDTVAAIAAWKPPSPFAGLTAADCNRALDLIAAGPGAGAAYAAWRRGRSGERWAGRVLMREFGLEEGEAARVIAAWMRSGVLEEASYHDGQQRKPRLGVRVIDARRPTDTPGSSPGAGSNLNNERNKS
jgi:hypothetical protein